MLITRARSVVGNTAEQRGWLETHTQASIDFLRSPALCCLPLLMEVKSHSLRRYTYSLARFMHPEILIA
jgi:hypothetical protein